MRFADIIGLDDVKQTLVQAAHSGHVAHALLFLGREGYSHLPLALAYAAFLNCLEPLPDDACGKCPSCSKYGKWVHPDLHFVYPTASTKQFSGSQAVSSAFLPDWRTFLRDQPHGELSDWLRHIGADDKQANISKEESRHIVRSLAMRAFEARYKVMLIWLPELMHPAAANAILKILEEPPPKTVFMLVSNNADQLLATILSRTQLVKVPALSDADMARLLRERHGIEGQKALQAAHLAQGNFNEALKLASEIADESAQRFQEWMRRCFKLDFTGLVEEAEQFQRLGKEAQKGLLQYGLGVLRETLMHQAGASALLRLPEAERQFAANFAKALNAETLPRMAELLGHAFQHVERNANPKILFLHLSVQIARVFRAKA
jgi:DNA polymerase-3 subunit delta'